MSADEEFQALRKISRNTTFTPLHLACLFKLKATADTGTHVHKTTLYSQQLQE